MTYPKNLIPANDPGIQHFGRWDLSDSRHPRYLWPRVYIYDEFPGGYAANGHPTVVTHQKMASQMIQSMESFNLFQDNK